MLEIKEIVKLGKIIQNANPSTPVAYSFNGKDLSFEALNETLRREFHELALDYNTFQQNKWTIFKIMAEILDDVLPKKVIKQYERFAETKVLDQGDQAIFRRNTTNNNRAKQFITRVGPAGVYEVFKLGKSEEAFEVRTSAIGGAAQVGFEEFLDGRVDFVEVTKIIMDGIDELIYKEVGEALKASVNQLPPANLVVTNGFDEDAMDKLITIASAYGTPTVYCTYEFAVKMIPQQAWRYTEEMKDQLWRTGRLPSYKGTQVVVLEQGFEDETNTTKVIDPGYAYVIPNGANAKPVKIALEGKTLISERDSNYDWSREIQVYKKVGVTAMLTNDVCAYVDTSLAGQMETWNLNGYKTVKDYGKA